jgi:RNA polymerase sigma-70 factor (ECF subfamily)
MPSSQEPSKNRGYRRPDGLTGSCTPSHSSEESRFAGARIHSKNSQPDSDFCSWCAGESVEPQETSVEGLGASGGGNEAFWDLWQLHQKYLYAICLRQMGGIRADAEDALSRAMLKAFEKLPDYRSKVSNPKAWLTRLVFNLCIDILRERSRQTKWFTNVDEVLLPVNETKPFYLGSPESSFIYRERYLYMTHKISELPFQLREPFVLRFVQEMSYREIAIKLTLSKENVRKRIQKARAALREQLTNDSAFAG